MVIRTDEKRTASGTAMMKTESAAPNPMYKTAPCSPAWTGVVRRALAMAKEMPIEMTESAAVVSAVVRTNRNLPRTKCVREIALEAFGDFDDHGNLLVDDFLLPIRFQRNDLNLRYFFQSCENTG